MARKPRLHSPGGVYHVMVRGNGGQDIFFDDDDRYHFYLLLQEGIARYGHRIHGFCLMSNHVHLALQVGEDPLAKILQNLSFRYTRWINRKQQRIGHLFQGRYKAILVDQDSYLLELVRYIHLNPIRAKMVQKPAAYPWSGHRAYLGKQTLPWLETGWVLSQFGKRLTSCRQRYEAFVRAGMSQGYRQEFHRGGDDHRLLGDDTFTEKALGKATNPIPRQCSLDDLMAPVCQAYQLTVKTLVATGRNRQASEARQIIAWLAQKTDSVSLTAIGTRFGRDVTTLGHGVHRVEERARSDKRFAKQLKQYYNAIMQA